MGHQAQRGRVVRQCRSAVVIRHGGAAHARSDRAIALHDHAIGGESQTGHSQSHRGKLAASLFNCIGVSWDAGCADYRKAENSNLTNVTLIYPP